jgi:hypothetical protein
LNGSWLDHLLHGLDLAAPVHQGGQDRQRQDGSDLLDGQGVLGIEGKDMLR